jgi:DNA polymerase (family 10)
LGRAWSLLDPIVDRVRGAVGHEGQVTVVGDVRRVAPIIDALAVLVIAPRPDVAIDAFLGEASPKDVLHRTGRTATLRIRQATIQLHVAAGSQAGPAMVSLTGPTAHVGQLRERARTFGLDLTDGTLRSRAGTAIDCPDEPSLYAALSLPLIPPELREWPDAVEAAASSALPRLVTTADIKGDLHVHTSWSDGRHSIAEMVAAAAELQYEYVAITDHSHSSRAANGLDRAALAAQREEIDAARRAFPMITILHGSEVDILSDGRLDFPDDVLAGLDIVLASLHDPGSDSPARLTDRYLAAMRHPLVHIVTHPTNRMVGSAPGYDLDFDALFGEAVRTGTVLEVDGSPIHLDMDGDIARRAIDAGVTISIDSDCHHAERLGRQMTFGVGTARRGWVEARHVLNTRSLTAVRDFLDRKRRAA